MWECLVNFAPNNVSKFKICTKLPKLFKSKDMFTGNHDFKSSGMSCTKKFWTNNYTKKSRKLKPRFNTNKISIEAVFDVWEMP